MIDRFHVGLGFFGEIDVDRWTRQISLSCVFAKKKKKMLLTLKKEDRREDEVFDYRKREGNEG